MMMIIGGTTMTNYHDNSYDRKSYHVGVVAIPHDFEILDYMSIRELCEIFPVKDINIDQITFLLNSLKTQTIWVLEPTDKRCWEYK